MKINTEILTDYLNEQCNEETKQRVENWINEDPEHQYYFEELKFYWECQSANLHKIEIDSEKGYRELKEKRAVSKRLKIRRLVQYAAAVAVLIASGLTSYIFLSPSLNQIIVENRESKEKRLNLPDGSSILLARGSSIEYSKNFSEKERLLKLSGEAFFNVTKDKQKPFIILTSHSKTQVVGTSFRIKEANSKTSIEVESGIVDFMEVNDPANKVRLVKGDMAKLMNRQQVILKGKKELQNADFKIQRLEYQNEKLISICNDLNELFNTNIRLKGEDIPHLTMTAIFEDQNLDHILESISFSLDLEIEKQSDYILLK
jgi:ferric-dicitrate binding protein FerR (iron transport regulator)